MKLCRYCKKELSKINKRHFCHRTLFCTFFNDVEGRKGLKEAMIRLKVFKE